MNRTPSSQRRPALCWAVLLALLLVAALVSPVAAREATPSAAAPVVFAVLRSILGDQSTMIQVGVVIAAIAIFWLSRSPKG